MMAGRCAARRSTTLLAVLLPLLLTAACTGTARMYDGPERPKEELALIRPKLHDVIVTFVSSVEILTIDGRALRGSDDSAAVLPGRHTVTASRGAGTGPRISMELELDAVAGHVYEVEGATLSYTPPAVAIWIVDAADQKIVAGSPPPPEH